MENILTSARTFRKRFLFIYISADNRNSSISKKLFLQLCVWKNYEQQPNALSIEKTKAAIRMFTTSSINRIALDKVKEKFVLIFVFQKSSEDNL